MSVERTVTVTYSKQSLGQRDQVETYSGTAEVKITHTKVQLVDQGIVIVEIDRNDWREIRTML